MTTIGIAVSPLDIRQTRELAQTLEELGFHSIWLTDAGGGLGYSEGTKSRSALVLAHAALAVTSRLTVGIGVTSPFACHPVSLSSIVATLTETHGQRLVLGIGVGREPGWLRSPLVAMREALTISRSILQTGTARLSGDVFQADTTLDFDFPSA